MLIGSLGILRMVSSAPVDEDVAGSTLHTDTTELDHVMGFDSSEQVCLIRISPST